MANMPQGLFGPILPPPDGSRRKVVVLLHGYGSNGDNLMDLGRGMQPHLPGTTFMAPHGFDPWEGGADDSYQWFSIQSWTTDTLLRDLQRVSPRINAFLDDVLRQYDLTDADLILGGFSQGAMVSLFSALMRPKPIGGVLAYSGCLIWSDTLKPQSLPPVLLVHGTADDVVPYASLDDAKKRIESFGGTVSALSVPRLGHSIDGQGMAAGLSFIRQCFQGQTVEDIINR